MIGENYLNNVVTLRMNPSKCTGCRMCTIVCPHAVFKMEDKRATIKNLNRCMECGACAVNCPEGAIIVRAGVGCAAGILNGLMNNSEPNCGCAVNPLDKS